MTFHILGIIVLTNSIIFQRGRLKPPTRKSLAFQLVGGSLIPLAGFMMWKMVIFMICYTGAKVWDETDETPKQEGSVKPSTLEIWVLVGFLVLPCLSCFSPISPLINGWWFGTCFFHNIWDVILPIDELIFFKMVIAPPTRSPLLQANICHCTNVSVGEVVRCGWLPGRFNPPWQGNFHFVNVLTMDWSHQGDI